MQHYTHKPCKLYFCFAVYLKRSAKLLLKLKYITLKWIFYLISYNSLVNNMWFGGWRTRYIYYYLFSVFSNVNTSPRQKKIQILCLASRIRTHDLSYISLLPSLDSSINAIPKPRICIPSEHKTYALFCKLREEELFAIGLFTFV